jgi:small subunit ribosomal protein S2
MITQQQEDITRQLAKQYLKTGIQYGHKPKEWNPKMAPYILSEKYGFHLFDLVQTSKFLRLAGNMLEKKANEQKQILFVGTSKVASPTIAKYANKSNSFYINYRWLGGMLTNWPTIQKRITKLKELEIEYNTGEFEKLSKKEYNKKRKKLERLQHFFEGIKEMQSLPDVVIFTSQIKEKLAIQECQKLGIPSICIVDSNCNPDLVPYPIPANDDAPGGIDLILKYFSERIQKGKMKEIKQQTKKIRYTSFPNKKISFKEKIFGKKKSKLQKKTLKKI